MDRCQANGKKIVLADDTEVEVALPFDFPVCYTSAKKLYLSDNGSVFFGTQAPNISPRNTSLDDVTLPGQFVAPFWDDLDDTNGGVYTYTMGTAPDRQFIIEWYRRPHYSRTADSGTITFQMILYENGNIKFQYQDVDFGNAGLELWSQCNRWVAL